MDRIEKFLKKLRKKEIEAFLLLMNQLKKDFRKVPGIKRLVGKKNFYRVRLGKYRIVFEAKKKIIEIIRITKRDDQTYRNI
ncbi:type II toxin-antitoxin system RelE/ParE family toxin [Patescibacteria group bacterium]